MDLDGTMDVRTGNVVPGDADDALACGCELFEGVWEEIEVVVAAAGTFIHNLPSY